MTSPPSPSPSSRLSQRWPQKADLERGRSSSLPPPPLPPRRGAPATGAVPFWVPGRRRSRPTDGDGRNLGRMKGAGETEEGAEAYADGEAEEAARALLAAASFGLPPSAPQPSGRGKHRRHSVVGGGGDKGGWFGRSERRRMSAAAAAAPKSIRAENGGGGVISGGAEGGRASNREEPESTVGCRMIDTNDRDVGGKAEGTGLDSSDGDIKLRIDDAINADASGAMESDSPKHRSPRNEALDKIEGGKGASQANHLSTNALVVPSTAAPSSASVPVSAAPLSSRDGSAVSDNSDSINATETSAMKAPDSASGEGNGVITGNEKGNVQDDRSGGCGDKTQDVNVSFDSFVRDAQALLDSDELRKFASSSQCLAFSAASSSFSFAWGATRTAARLAVLPVTAPVSATTSAASFALDIASGAAGMALHAAGDTAKHAAGLAAALVPVVPADNSSGEARGQRRHFFLLDPLGALLPVAMDALGKVRDEAGSCVLGILGWQSAGQSSSEGCGDFGGRIGEAFESSSDRDDTNEADGNDVRRIRCESGEEPSEGEEGVCAEARPGRDKSPPRKIRSFMRVCDLGIGSSFSSSSSSSGAASRVPFVELRPARDDKTTDLALDALVRRGLALASCRPSSDSSLSPSASEARYRPEWKPDGPTSRILRRFPSLPQSSSSAADGSLLANPRSDGFLALLETETLFWSSSPGSLSYSKTSPLFRGRGIILGLSPRDLAELLLDSGRVGEYNKYALGRVDEVVLRRAQGGREVPYGACDDGSDEGEGVRGANLASAGDDIAVTKVVSSENRVPFGGKIVSLRNVMHAMRLSDVQTDCCGDLQGEGEGERECECNDEGGYIIVSRSVCVSSTSSSTFPNDPLSFRENETENEIVWGVNVLRPVPKVPGSPLNGGAATDLLCVSQIESNLVPPFMQERLGGMGVSEFFRSVRALGEQKMAMAACNQRT
uniref:START domain-containing protein n=1 Tax=Odontella aurita TaxID=265563 RepID=A0A7S4IU60_9STRA|mmetsp:Transcript_3030/g.7884  ORF Transcript_3030/g.7884 Transcript_3030/m.7884 type:complete len:954 (+) Transcript_3030:210-3071(+)|eukprot:CAMPEP_0113556172 /NCGR_PEP_ID=MMETSP0015_2-20120614/17115_1 /TAXON_ID=2838 /ORGANISM="Odontella" /LENGTH=953 /DNA_ID=CAMNT_0000457511 /DNA_START=102 /DNA_END=2963 /DNA_ORIENTATION=- /assembly_acc=CAM_ASM_000160